jgi:hypothetical protein
MVWYILPICFLEVKLKKFKIVGILLLIIFSISFYNVIAQEGSNFVFLPLFFYGSNGEEPTQEPTPPADFSKISPAHPTSNTPTQITLTWEITSPVTHYEYCITKTSSCTEWVSTGTDNFVEISNLETNTGYRWQIRAWYGSFGPTYANRHSNLFWFFITGSEITGAPAAFERVYPENSVLYYFLSPTLSWEMTSPLTHFEYCVNTEYDCSNWISIGTENSVQLSGLESDRWYFWHVRAWNGSLGPTYANGIEVVLGSFYTGFFNKITPRGDAEQVSINPTFGWNSNHEDIEYEYCYDTIDDNQCDNWVSNGERNIFSLSNLNEGTTYYWHVRAIDNYGAGYPDGDSTDFWMFTTENNLPPNPIKNGDFEAGKTDWNVHSDRGYDLIKDLTGDTYAYPPPSGTWAVELGGYNNEYATISQTVYIPNGRSVLHYWFYSWSIDIPGYDYFFVKIGEDYTGYVDHVGLNKEDATNAWVHRTVDLSDYAGTTQTITFLASCDFSKISGIYLDNISLEATDY